MFIPKKVVAFAQKLEEDRLAREKEEADRKAKRAEKERKLDQEKEDRTPELLDALAVIFSWLDEFIGSEVCLSIFKNRHRVILFTAKYWLGRPNRDKDDVVTFAKIEYRRDRHIYYCEVHKGRDGTPIDLLDFNNFSRDFTDTQNCINKLHPDFIVDWAIGIKNGNVWERVLRS